MYSTVGNEKRKFSPLQRIKAKISIFLQHFQFLIEIEIFKKFSLITLIHFKLKPNKNVLISDRLDSAAQSPSSSLFSDFDDACTSSFASSLSSPTFATSSESGSESPRRSTRCVYSLSSIAASSLSSFDMMMSMFPDPTRPTVSDDRMAPPAATVRKNVVGKKIESKFL